MDSQTQRLWCSLKLLYSPLSGRRHPATRLLLVLPLAVLFIFFSIVFFYETVLRVLENTC